MTRAVWATPFSLAATRGITCLFSPPAATKMFQFTAFASLAGSPSGGVPPFGHPRVNGCLRLAGEFRRLSRPSSPLGARASSVRPCLLLFRGRGLAAGPLVSLSACQCASRAVWPNVEVARRLGRGRLCLAALQKGGVPAAPSGTATLLRLSPNYQFCPRPLLAVTDFRHPRLSWLDGRCVQGPGTYSPRHG